MMKRFYTLVSTRKTDDGHIIQLDGKSVKTPLEQSLAAPTKSLAEAIVLEWAGQEDKVKPDTMPLTQILTTAIDKIRDRDAITASMMRYLDTDLVCYWTKEPEELAKRQKEIWGRWVKWFDEHYEVPLDTTKKIDAIEQDPEAHKRVWNYIESLDEYYFTVLHIMTSVAGSLVLALAFVEDDITEEEIFEASYLEELYRGEIYNEELHGAAPNDEAERAAFKVDTKAARQFFRTRKRLLTMSKTPDGLIVGEDGKSRCWWHGNDPEYLEYHDTEWGYPVSDDRHLFEKICLEGFQAGLSWLTILRKRDNFRKAFDDFEYKKISKYNEKKILALLQNSGIIRHRGKIEATINNAIKAQNIIDEFGSLSNYFWQFGPSKSQRPQKCDYETLKMLGQTEESQAMSKDLKKRGWKFVGPTTCYAFMQSMGIVNDHLEGCYCRDIALTEYKKFKDSI